MPRRRSGLVSLQKLVEAAPTDFEHRGGARFVTSRIRDGPEHELAVCFRPGSAEWNRHGRWSFAMLEVRWEVPQAELTRLAHYDRALDYVS